MATQFSPEELHKMGFQAIPEGSPITARFSSITAFEIRGITLNSQTTKCIHGKTANVEYGIAISSSLNDACEALMNEKYVDDECEWRREHKCLGPFALISIGPTPEFVCSTGWFKEEQDGSLTTDDSFRDCRKELRDQEGRALPCILSSLACVFNEDGRSISFRRLYQSSVGKTSAGQVVHDLQVELKCEMYVSHDFPACKLEEKLIKSVEFAESISPKVSNLFSLGLTEKDEFKKFIYFFLALEVATNAIFEKIENHEKNKIHPVGHPSVSRSVDPPKRHKRKKPGLMDKFIQCRKVVWTQLLDDDIEQFKKLKKVRNKIAHGSSYEPPDGYAHLAEQLARKILRQS